MVPPFEPDLVPDVWFCPVCIARNWDQPVSAIQTAATTLPFTLVAAIPLLSTGLDAAREKETTNVETANPQIAHHSRSSQQDDQESQNRSWRGAQRWKHNACYTPSGYLLDPSCDENLYLSVGRAKHIAQHGPPELLWDF
jgi:hypothetical protein